MMQELNYIRCGDYYIPDIRLPEENRPIGRWGRMHRDYIKEHMNIRRRYGVNIIAVEHDGHTDVNFAAEYCFREGDVISVVGQIKNLEHFEEDIQ